MTLEAGAGDESLEKGWLELWLGESGALRRGHFLLSSGLHSPAYVQCALLLESPSRARRIGRALADLLRPYRPESVLSPALGGLVIGHETAAALELPFRFCERVDRAMTLRRGFELREGERVVVVEDVVTTGGSAREAAELAGDLGADVCAVGSILDRGSGSSPFTQPFAALKRLDLETWSPAECPLCREGTPAVKPGSRGLA